jgi:hypothetical protein
MDAPDMGWTSLPDEGCNIRVPSETSASVHFRYAPPHSLLSIASAHFGANVVKGNPCYNENQRYCHGLLVTR